METNNQESQKTNNMSTTIISIPGAAASGVLKSLHENKISSNYMGFDQSGRILMQITYEARHNDPVREINSYIEMIEDFLTGFNLVLNELMEKHSDEINKVMEVLKKKYEDRKKASTKA